MACSNHWLVPVLVVVRAKSGIIPSLNEFGVEHQYSSGIFILPGPLSAIMSTFVMVLSGFSGGMGSIFGKLALSPEIFIMKAISTFICKDALDLEFTCPTVSIILQVTAFAGMFYCNIVMLSYFLKALETRGSLPVTVVCSAVNFIVTGALGGLILGEEVNLRWCLGATFIMVGIVFIMFSQGGQKVRK